MIRVKKTRKLLGKLAQKMAGNPAEKMTIIGVTGTNGKTTVSTLVWQILTKLKYKASLLGTIEKRILEEKSPSRLTTADPIELAESMREMVDAGTEYLAMEVSSHALDQRRTKGISFDVAVFTNLSQDHLDYHPDFDDYFNAKLGLFNRVAAEGAPAVINMDSDWSAKMAEGAKNAGHEIVTIGWRGRDLAITEIVPHPTSQTLCFSWRGEAFEVELPLIGEFQTSNALTAAALAVITGVEPSKAFRALAKLKGVAGRLEQVGETREGAPIFIDYAHTPDGLDKLLRAVRPHTQGRVVLVFGAGGDRDPSKRAKMGAIAAKLADTVFVTDDNPRSEDPMKIRKQVLEGCPDCVEIADRSEAIKAAIQGLEAGDTLVISGKGHETGQIVGDKVLPFNEPQIVKAHLKAVEQ